MPLPMVHFSVAVRLYGSLQMEPPASFLLGSIAPDAIHMREGAGRADKNRTHFAMAVEESEGFQKLGTYLQEWVLHGSDESEHAFAKGYCIHVLTDALWVHAVFSDFRREADKTMGKLERRSLYYRETGEIDYRLYCAEQWRPKIWGLLEQSPLYDVPSLLTADEVGRWRVHTLDWFLKQKDEPAIEPQYITEAVIQSFIDDAVTEVHSHLRQWQIEL